MIKLIGSVLYHTSLDLIVWGGFGVLFFLWGGGVWELSSSFDWAGWSWLFISISLPANQGE